MSEDALAFHSWLGAGPCSLVDTDQGDCELFYSIRTAPKNIGASVHISQ